jgi:7,8-dihydroneopterin aldolase/epimerase/oxygenase
MAGSICDGSRKWRPSGPNHNEPTLNAIDRDTDFDELETVPRGGLRRIFVRGLELIGSIGIYEHEKRYEQRIVVSVDLAVDDHYDGHSDRIGDIYDYDEAIGAVKSIVAAGHVNLLETLAERIAEACLANPDVISITVRIEKPDILPIEITRRRSQR